MTLMVNKFFTLLRLASNNPKLATIQLIRKFQLISNLMDANDIPIHSQTRLPFDALPLFRVSCVDYTINFDQNL